MTTVKRKSRSKKKPLTSSQEVSLIKSTKLERLISERKKRGMNQSDVAVAIGVSVALISHIENGRVKPSLDVSLGIQELFRLPFETLFPDY